MATKYETSIVKVILSQVSEIALLEIISTASIRYHRRCEIAGYVKQSKETYPSLDDNVSFGRRRWILMQITRDTLYLDLKAYTPEHQTILLSECQPKRLIIAHFNPKNNFLPAIEGSIVEELIFESAETPCMAYLMPVIHTLAIKCLKLKRVECM